MSGAGLRRAGMVDMEPNTTLVQQFPAHEAVPDSPSPAPAVVLLHDARGLTPEVRALAHRIARQGFFTLAPNLYAQPFSVASGAPPWMSAPMAGAAEGFDGFPVRPAFGAAETEEAGALAASLTRERARELVGRAIRCLAFRAESDPARTGILGLGTGGRIAFRSACELGDRIRALAVWSGADIASRSRAHPAETMPILEYESLRSPALFLYGAADPEISPEERTALGRVLASARLRHEIVAYPDAGHEFYDGASPDFWIAAGRDAWERTIGFFHETLGGAGSAA